MNIFRNTFKVTRLVVIFSLAYGCNNNQTKIKIDQNDSVIQFDSLNEIIWHVKAYHPDVKLLDVKAIDKEGNIYDVKAIQNSDQTSIMDVKAFVKGKQLPVKILISEDQYLPVKAIDTDGTIIDIMALTTDGHQLEIKGVGQSGNIIHIKAIDTDGAFYNIEAISPKGWINDVKGIKMFKEPIEATINGVDVYSHVKSIPQVF